MLNTVYLVAEDEPGLAVGRKLIAETANLTVYGELNGHGFGNLRSKISNYHKMGKHMPVLMLTDLDNQPCPSALIQDWLGQKPSSAFLFRICIREIEAWLLAHREAMAAFLKININLITEYPEKLSNPKAELIRLAQKAPRTIRKGITPVRNATIGPDYNLLLSGFIRDLWSPEIAQEQSPSLKRARLRIGELDAKL